MASCTVGCANSCTTCSGTCTGSCVGGCSGGNCGTGCAGSCSGCSGSCSGRCLGCSSCSGTCSGCSSCSGTCSGTCSGCSGSCSGTCSSCSGTCDTACNKTCTGKTQTTNINKLTLNEKIMQKDIANIKTAIDFEVVNRRGITLPYKVTFNQSEQLDDTKITQIIANLKKAGQTSAYTASAGSKALKDLALDLIQKIKNANNATIGL